MASEARKKAAQEQLFDGRFLLDDVIGRGRQSIVYRAEQLDPPTPLQRIVAVKLIFGGNKDPEGVFRRVRREALGMLASRSEHTIRLFDYLITSEQPYLVMEFAERGDLKAYATRQGGSLEFSEAIEFTIQALRGLSSVHRAGMIHRDIKAENLLLTGQRGVKIADFSIASVPNEYLTLEKANPVIGTFDYLAPESLTDGICSIRSDLYAMAMTLYELITGIYPFGDGPFSEQVSKKLAADWTPLPEYLNPVPPFLPELFRIGLASRPESRFGSAEEFIEALESVRRGSWQPLQEPALVELPPEEAAANKVFPELEPVEEPVDEVPLPPPRRLPRRLVAGLCFLAGILLAGILAGPKLLSLFSSSRPSDVQSSLTDPLGPPALVSPNEGKDVTSTPPIAEEKLKFPAEAPPIAKPEPARAAFTPTYSVRMAQHPALPAVAVISVEMGADVQLRHMILQIEQERWSLPLVPIPNSADAWTSFPTPEKSFSLIAVGERDGETLSSTPLPIDIDCQAITSDDGESSPHNHPLLTQAIRLAAQVDLLAMSYDVGLKSPQERQAPPKIGLPPFPKGPGAHRFSCLMANPNSKLLSLKSEKLQELMELRTNKSEILMKEIAALRTDETLARLNARAERAGISELSTVFPKELSESQFIFRLSVLGAAEDLLRRR